MTEARVSDIDVTSEMETSFLEYAYSVIYTRALPDARDGLKPVQRRILFQMRDMNLLPERPYVKSARVVGEVMGKLHPHGDSAIYDALVRLAQPFNLRLPLVDGHGNFGSLDDGPAASRYTEVRMAAAAVAMTDSLGEDVVDFIPNYDNKLQQPEVLPAAIPALLVNGAAGIAVGMATNMPPHNLREVINAAKLLMFNPQATLSQVMEFVPGPDLPTGGKIIGLTGITDAYESGRGTFKIRATATIENITARKKGIIFTELPYLVGPEKVIEKIKEGVQNKKLSGISAVADLTDRKNGLRLVVEVKTGFNPDAVLEQLYRYTPLEDSFGINNVALVDGQPKTLGLIELLQVWIAHRIAVVERRCTYRLNKRLNRLHLLEGLLKAILNIDEVIEVIRSSEQSSQAKSRLQDIFDLSEIQAEYILELKLRRLTKFSQIELTQERDQILEEIKELQEILGDEQKLKQLIAIEMDQVVENFGTERRTVLLHSTPVVASLADTPTKRGQNTLEIPDTACEIYLGTSGLLARSATILEPTKELGRRQNFDTIRARITTTARSEYGLITSLGRVIKASALELPVLAPNATTLAGALEVQELVGLEKGEIVIGLLALDQVDQVLALATKQGTVKRVVLSEIPNKESWELITLKPGDRVINTAHAQDESTLVFITSTGSLLHFAAKLVRPQGRLASGMAGIKLPENAEVIHFAVVNNLDDATLVTIAGTSSALAGTQIGSAKLTPLADFPGKGRATSGVRAHRFLRGEDQLILACCATEPIWATSPSGKPVDLPAEPGKRDASGTALASPVNELGTPMPRLTQGPQNETSPGPVLDFELE